MILLINLFQIFFLGPLISSSLIIGTSFADEFLPEGLSETEQWVKSLSSGDLTVYTKKMPKTKLVGFKMTGTLGANASSLMAHLRNVERSAEWTPQLIEKITLKNTSDLEASTYSLNSLPWPLSNRDFILHNKLYLSKEKKLLFITSKSIKDPHYPKKEGIVRAWIHYSNIGLRPINEKKTYIEWTLFVDPKGQIPSWLVNFYQSRFPIQFFNMAEKRANSVTLKLPEKIKNLLDELQLLLKKDATKK